MPYLLDQAPIPFRSRPILFIDLELTGLDPSRHEIIEIAALKVSQPDFKIENSYYAKITPQHINTADDRCLSVTSYSPSAWKDALDLSTALLELSRFAPGCFLAGWVVQTEWEFLNASLKEFSIPVFYDHRLLEVSTLAFSRFHSQQNPKFLSLSQTAKFLGIPLENHLPDSDIRATYQIFRQLIDK
jgi:DNA polymerase III alpha subunit (gram-positive type)